MSYKQKAVEKLEEMEEGTRGIIAATIRLCILVLKEIPEEYPKETLKETPEEDIWFPATEPPKESEEVLICEIDKKGNVIYMIAVPYSKKYNAFNVRDHYEDAKTELHPDYWKPIPKRVEELRIRAPEET